MEQGRMQIVFWRNRLAQSAWAMAAAMAGVFFFCLIFLSYENAFLLSSIVAAFVLPSVLSFVLIEKFFQKAWLKHFSFFLPLSIITVGAFFNYLYIKIAELEVGSGDGAEEALIMATTFYFIGIVIAYAFLLISGFLTKKV